MADTNTQQKRAAAKSAAATTNDAPDAKGTVGSPGRSHTDAPPAGSAVTGPGTGTESPADEQARGQARASGAHAAAPDSAPIEAPDLHGATLPVEGKAGSSTNTVTDAVALRTTAGEDHAQIVDGDGNEIDLADGFDDPGADKTFVTAKTRISELFWPIGADRNGPPFERLLFPQGARVSKGRLAGLVAAQAPAQAQTEQNVAGI